MIRGGIYIYLKKAPLPFALIWKFWSHRESPQPHTPWEALLSSLLWGFNSSIKSRGLMGAAVGWCELRESRERVFPMHVTTSHYYNPRPPPHKVLTVGQEISQLRELWMWMRADSQWRSAEGARKAWISSSSSPPQGADWSTSLSPLHAQNNHLITMLIQIKPAHKPPFAEVQSMHNHSTLWGQHSDRPVCDWNLYWAFKSFSLQWPPKNMKCVFPPYSTRVNTVTMWIYYRKIYEYS